jgi:hypothetical protein
LEVVIEGESNEEEEACDEIKLYDTGKAQEEERW